MSNPNAEPNCRICRYSIQCDAENWTICRRAHEADPTGNILGRVNAGYRVIRQGKLAVIAEKIDKRFGDYFVAWHYKQTQDGDISYFWGRYGGLDTAEKAFANKEAGIYSGD